MPATDASGSTYPPQDGGEGAWLFLLGACIIEVTAWGFPYCYGVFEAYFNTHPPFQGQNLVSTGGVLSNGVLQLSLPPVMYYVNNFPKHRIPIMWLGCSICAFSAIGAGFARTPLQLIMTIGLLYGMGAGMLFGPSIHLMAEWFKVKKSLAYGFMCAAAGAGLPPVYTACLNRYGYKATLIGWGIITFIVTSLGLLCIRPRLPVSAKPPSPSRKDFEFAKKPLFLIMLIATMIQAAAHYGPSLYLPSFGADFALSPAEAAMLASLLNLAQAIGQPLQGWLADWRKSYYIPMLISTVGASLEALLIWGFARNLWSLSVFAVAFGSTAGGFAVLRPRFAAEIVGDQEEQDNQSLLVFAILTASRGSAIIGSGFIMKSLVHEGWSTKGWGGGPAWSNLVIYTGAIMFAASFGAVGMFVGPARGYGRAKKQTPLGDA
ncbi:MFS general substrate transporter [Aureobasidium namibiae CBS 147.97]|uniref:MFS general substrate transporter n=1 Tax=Aureobasidium namibiae CBS 147.97 TaxID=1043004 RepID=A0A074X515_9PEZI